MGLSERAKTLEQQIIATARRKALNATSWFTPAELARLNDVSAPDLDVQLHGWKEMKMLFSVHHEGIELFPAYNFTDDKLQPLSGLHEILTLFAGKKDDWGVAYWFASANGYLGGKRPQDVLGPNPEEVLLAAKDELAGVTHG